MLAEISLQVRLHINFRPFSHFWLSNNWYFTKKLFYTAFSNEPYNNYFFILVKHCILKIKNNEANEYISNNVKYISNSSPEECCISCYYNKSCLAWNMHRQNKMCTLTLSLKGNFLSNANKNFISGLKPTFIA